MNKWAALCLTATLSLGTAANALAQQTQQAQPPAPQAAPAPDISDSQLKNFISTSEKLAVVNNKYAGQLQSTKDKKSQQEIYAAANKEMTDTVRENGMSVQQFNQIGQAIQQDPKLMERAQKLAQ